MDSQEQFPSDFAQAAPGARQSFEAHSLSVGQRLLVLALNALPLLHVLGVVAVVVCPWAAVAWRVVAALGVLYLLPAALAGMIVRRFPFRSTVVQPGSPEFFKWWALFSLQVLFCRLPALEEAMRIIPSLYSAWLRLWGSRIGRLVYWAPGTRILDRSFLVIGDDVVFGAGVRLNPHVMARNDGGQTDLLLAPVKIGPRTLVGGYSLLTAGTEIPADETTRACLLSPPFTKWRDGKRVKE